MNPEIEAMLELLPEEDRLLYKEKIEIVNEIIDKNTEAKDAAIKRMFELNCSRFERLLIRHSWTKFMQPLFFHKYSLEFFNFDAEPNLTTIIKLRRHNIPVDSARVKIELTYPDGRCLYCGSKH